MNHPILQPYYTPAARIPVFTPATVAEVKSRPINGQLFGDHPMPGHCNCLQLGSDRWNESLEGNGHHVNCPQYIPSNLLFLKDFAFHYAGFDYIIKHEPSLTEKFTVIVRGKSGVFCRPLTKDEIPLIREIWQAAQK